MIKTFRNKNLKELFETKASAGINPKHHARCLEMLDAINRATNIQQIRLPGYDLHQLKHVNRDLWAAKVNGPWRITFIYKNGNATDVDYAQYH